MTNRFVWSDISEIYFLNDKNSNSINGLELEKKYNISTLIPYQVVVHRPHKAPYFSTRWKKIYLQEPKKEHFHIVPIKNYVGNLNIIYDAWKKYIGGLDEERQELLLPLLALQEILFKNYDGILATVENRIIGIASIFVNENNEAEESILSASPWDIIHNQEEKIEGLLREGLKQYIEKSDYDWVGLDIEKMKVAFHEHDSYPEHSVAVKDHLKYFAGEEQSKFSVDKVFGFHNAGFFINYGIDDYANALGRISKIKEVGLKVPYIGEQHIRTQSLNRTLDRSPAIYSVPLDRFNSFLLHDYEEAHDMPFIPSNLLKIAVFIIFSPSVAHNSRISDWTDQKQRKELEMWESYETLAVPEIRTTENIEKDNLVFGDDILKDMAPKTKEDVINNFVKKSIQQINAEQLSEEELLLGHTKETLIDMVESRAELFFKQLSENTKYYDIQDLHEFLLTEANRRKQVGLLKQKYLIGVYIPYLRDNQLNNIYFRKEK